jgi:hypothetical protein
MRQMATSHERTIVRIWSRRVSSFRRGRDERHTHKDTHTHEHQTQTHRHDRRNKIIV